MKMYDSSDFRKALNTSNMVIALFYMRTCPFCQKFIPIFRKHDGRSATDLVMVDISNENSPLWDEYNIEYVPSIIIFRQGRPVLHMDARPGIGLKESDLDGAIARVMSPFQ